MQKETQKGHSNVPNRIDRCRRLFTRTCRLRGVHGKLIAVFNLLGILIPVCHLNHGKDLLGSRAGIRTHRLGIHLNINVVAILDQGLELNCDIGIIGSTTLIRLLNHQHY